MQIVPFIPENTPFNLEQRLWLNGYVAGLLAGRGYVRADEKAAGDGSSATATIPLLILFGSQTGTAEKLARNLARESKSRGCNSRVVEAAAYATIDWSKETNLLVVTSTYGDGDMPDNAQAFWEWLQTDGARAVAHLNFSVLALGDTHYEQFCGAGKKIDARLAQLGAKRIHPLAECDLDYEAKAKAWQEGALNMLNPASAATTPMPVVTAREPANAGEETFSRTNPFPARLMVNRRLTGDGSSKETRHFEISLENSGLQYEPGDALGVYPANCPALVDDLLQALGCDGNEPVTASGGELPLRQALTGFYDITRPSAELLQRIAARNPALARLLAPERQDDLRSWLRGREVIDLLLETPAAKFSPSEFAALLKKLAPRSYSISSSPRAHAGQVHLTVNMVRYESLGRARKGVCSTFLADRVKEAAHVPVFVQTSPNFRLPADGNIPIIMVGPGTGVAPFRSFLHERRAVAARGRNWLFFGEQHAALDFYYREELEAMLAAGQLTKLSTAFSRDQPEKIYVQHRMRENAAELWSWLEAGAHFYVCGDASRMAKDVDEALHQVVVAAGGRTTEEAKACVARLKAEKRYQRDVY